MWVLVDCRVAEALFQIDGVIESKLDNTALPGRKTVVRSGGRSVSTLDPGWASTMKPGNGAGSCMGQDGGKGNC